MNAVLKYQTNQIESEVNSKNKAEIVGLLNQKVYENLTQAIYFIDQQQYQNKTSKINKAIQIIEEGLLATLDENNGGDVAKNLKDFYLSSLVVITSSNLQNNTKDLKKIADSFNELKEAWNSIGKK